MQTQHLGSLRDIGPVMTVECKTIKMSNWIQRVGCDALGYGISWKSRQRIQLRTFQVSSIGSHIFGAKEELKVHIKSTSSHISPFATPGTSTWPLLSALRKASAEWRQRFVFSARVLSTSRRPKKAMPQLQATGTWSFAAQIYISDLQKTCLSYDYHWLSKYHFMCIHLFIFNHIYSFVVNICTSSCFFRVRRTSSLHTQFQLRTKIASLRNELLKLPCRGKYRNTNS